MGNQLASIDDTRRTLIDLAIRFGPKVLVALIILSAGVVVGRWVGRATERSLVRFDLEPPVRQLFVRLVRLLVLGLFLIMALQNLGVELLPLIAGLGIAGAGIALALQGVLGNLVAGLTIIFTKPYRVGEYIAIAGVEGRVDVISIFSTTLAHADRSRIVVPNRKIVGEILHNYGKIRQCELMVGIGYESDLKLALALISERVHANARVLSDPAPLIQVAALAESAVQVAVRPWVAVNDLALTEGELNLAIVEACRQHGIDIPVPQRAVRLIGQRP